ncbi:MAG: hypothetical protein J6I50_08005 [Clostridia bacterium]|nr:hypothetical protein [Clostridia bacterium]
MKRFMKPVKLSMSLVLAVLMLFSCNANQVKYRKIDMPASETKQNNPPSVQTTGYERTDLTTDFIETVTAEGAEKAPSVPYTLKHTVIDLSERLPDGLPEINSWTTDIDERNVFLIGNTLYLYSEHDETGALNPMLYHFTVDENGIEQGKVSVPIVNDSIPFYVYPLSEDRFVLFTYDNAYTNEKEYIGTSTFLYIAEADGTIICEVPLGEEYNYRPLYYWLEILINEDENQDAAILLNASYNDTYKLMVYQYHNDDHTITVEKKVYHNTQIANFHLDGACRTGEHTYIYPNYKGYAELDINKGFVQQKKLRLPEGINLSWRTTDAKGNIYLYDQLGLSQYQENSAPIECIEWEKCNFSCKKSVLDGQIFAVTPHTFFYKTAEKKGGITTHYLYYIQTESVPETDTRQVIVYDCYAYASQWLLDAVSEFNNTNEKYRVKLNRIDTVDKSVEEVSSYLQQRMLSNNKPDMLTMGLGHVTFDKYYEKNAFLDLMPYFGDTLLGCVKEALSWKGALYTVPMDMLLETFVCLPSQQKGFLTWEDFFWCMDSLEEGELLTTESSNGTSVAEIIIENGIMDFFDRENKTASYDSAAFRDMIRYTREMSQYIDENAGYFEWYTGGDYGYTNPTLPRRIADGGVKYIKVRIDNVDMLPGLGLLFGESGYNWCGYPSNEGGGAGLYMGDRTCVIADSAVKDGCIEFLSLLLSDKWQTVTDNIRNLPVTESAIRAQLAQCRYNYYDIAAYNAIGNPNAAMRSPSFMLPGITVPSYISLKQSVSRNTKLDESLCVTTYQHTKKNGEVVTMTEPKYQMVELTDTEMENFLYFLNNCHMKANTDPTLRTIVEEELSYWQGGVSSLADASEKIQSRVWIYLNE